MLDKNTKVGTTIGAAAIGVFFFAGMVWQTAMRFNGIEQKFVAMQSSHDAAIAALKGHHEDRYTKQDATIVALKTELVLRRAGGTLTPGDGVALPLP